MNSTKHGPKSPFIIFDNLHGFIPFTETEKAIINTPFFQRLRWLRQLGFSNFVFPGAEHTRFSHSLGTVNIMNMMLRSIGRAVNNEKLMSVRAMGEPAKFHKTMRLAALLHDIGQFPFSHTTEDAYMRHEAKRLQTIGETTKPEIKPGSHEELTYQIITETDYDGGITQILLRDGFDPEEIAKIATGTSDSLLANQLCHSDLDADRIDYLLRDAHHTGIKYGMFDWQYLINSLEVVTVNGKECLAVGEKGIAAASDFLLSRFSWYSQIIRNSMSAKFDVITAKVYEYLLDHHLVYSLDELKRLIQRNPKEFYNFNDIFLMNILQEEIQRGSIRDKTISELITMILYRIPPKLVTGEVFKSRYISSKEEREEILNEIKAEIARYKKLLKGVKNVNPWMLVHIPPSDIHFAKNLEWLERTKKSDSLLEERDPIRVVDSRGSISLLIEKDESILKVLSKYTRFIPAIYTSRATYEALESRGCFGPPKTEGKKKAA
ncbi:HD domain-containing protein [Bdellovibrionota bacterium]